MDNKHRQLIKENIDKLVALSDYDQLARKCVSYGLLSSTMKYNIEYHSKKNTMGDNTDKHKRLFEKITHRGPEAYRLLKQILSDLGNDKALQILNSHQSDDEIEISMHQRRNPQHSSPTLQVIESNKSYLTDFPEEQIDSLQVIKAENIVKDDLIGTYKMQSKNRGVLFLVNIINIENTDPRKGAKEDSRSLIYTFKQLGFKIFAYENCTQNVFFDELGKQLDSDDAKETECFVLALMSHGNIDNRQMERVQFSDGSIAKVEQILEYFHNTNCKNLTGKPKVLLFPFCRGSNPDRGKIIKKRIQTDALDLGSGTKIIPTLSDILICRAVPRGFESHRDTHNGSWYIQELCKVIAKHAHNTHFEDMIKLVDQKVSRMLSETYSLQTATYENIGFNRKLYLNPGLYIDSDNDNTHVESLT